jgi:hypothetical protein
MALIETAAVAAVYFVLGLVAVVLEVWHGDLLRL